MGFVVQPEALAKFATLVERNGINLSLSNVHLSGETNLRNTDGLWLQHLIGAHIPTVDRMSSSLFQGFHAMGGSADELIRTADHYRNVDHVAEANLDATYPASPRPSVEAPRLGSTTRTGQQGPFEVGGGDDIKDPLAFLTEPGTPADFSDPMQLFNAWVTTSARRGG